MKKAIEIQAPNEVVLDTEYTNVFLAGSIEMGVAEHWQKRVIDALSDKPIRFLNPRRDDWDSNLKEDSDELVEQIVWELTSLESSEIILLYLDPNTKSPISLLELGLHSKSKKLVVYCPKGFWRKTNVDVTCHYYDIDQVDSFEELISYVINKIEKK